jgi:hypothetical protein
MAVSGLALQSVAKTATGSSRNIKAVAFDGFPILDPQPVFARVDELYPERGVELSNIWRIRQFEYTWLRTMSRHYCADRTKRGHNTFPYGNSLAYSGGIDAPSTSICLAAIRRSYGRSFARAFSRFGSCCGRLPWSN